MYELAAQHFNFLIVPEVENQSFVKMVIDWYEYVILDELRLPGITNDMLSDCNTTQETFGSYLYDLQKHQYVKDKSPEMFNADVFPVDMHEEYWEMHDSFQDDYLAENIGVHEMFFFKDIKKVMDRFNMFYTDSYGLNVGWGKGKKITFHNIPIKEVW